MRKLLGYGAFLGAAALLYAWPPSHDFLVSPGVASVVVNLLLPGALLLMGWFHVRGGFRSFTLSTLFNYPVLLLMWGLSFTFRYDISSFDQFLHSWPVAFTVVYFAALIVAVPVAQWRRRHLVPSGGALQRYQPRGQSLQPRGGSAWLPASASSPVRNPRFDQFVNLTQAELIQLANNHRGPMRLFYEHFRGENGEEYMISRREWQD